MPKQRESRLSAQIQKALKLKGVFVFKVHGSSMMMAGLPDLIACVDGMFLGLETKNPGLRDNTSARQDLVHQQIKLAGGCCVVVCSVREAIQAVQYVRDFAARHGIDARASHCEFYKAFLNQP